MAPATILKMSSSSNLFFIAPGRRVDRPIQIPSPVHLAGMIVTEDITEPFMRDVVVAKGTRLGTEEISSIIDHNLDRVKVNELWFTWDLPVCL